MGDLELVEAVRRGDRQAWADVYDRYGPRLHALCTRLLNEPHTAADAVQDTFVVAAQRFDQLRDPLKLRAWLYAIARNECTRHGRARARVVPVEETATVSTPEHLDPGSQAAASEVAGLLWAAAEGLDERDRLLLELNVRHGLEGTELAEAAGISPGQVSMATGRMRERIERSIGALLVARRGRDDCAGLAAVLNGWDGTFSVLMRKRVARHIERCDLCDDRRRTLVAPLGSLAALPFVVPPTAIRDRVLDAVASVTSGGGPDLPATHETWPAGFPPLLAEPRRRRSATIALAAAAVVLLLVTAVLLAGLGADDTDTELVSGPAPSTTTAGPGGAAKGGGSGPSEDAATTTTEASTATTVPGTTPAGPGATTTTTAVGSPSGPDVGSDPGGQAGPLATTTPPVGFPQQPPVTVAPPVTSAPPVAPPNQAPTVGATTLSAPGPMQAACNPANATRQVTVTVTDDRGVAGVRLHWTAPDGSTGSRAMTRSGSTWTATLGTFAGAGTAGYRATATDTDGASRSSAARSITVDPCPG